MRIKKKKKENEGGKTSFENPEDKSSEQIGVNEEFEKKVEKIDKIGEENNDN